MNKKGAELSFNVIIIAILVILVLVVIAAFFLGGFGRLSDLIFGQAPSNLEVATNTCTSNCQLAQTYTTDQTKRNSGYCTKSFKFDYSPEDGNVDKDAEGNIKKYLCNQAPIGVTCPGVDQLCPSAQ